MQKSLYNHNMTVLKDKFHDFYINLTNPNFSDPDLKIGGIKNTSNFIINKGNIECALHSVISTNREMDMLFKPISKDDKQVIVIFGLGYGHCLDYIRKHKIKYKKVIIFEPCTNILFEVLKKRDVLEMLGLQDMYLHLLNLPNDMAKSLLQEAMETKTIKIICHLSYRTLFKDIYDNVLRSFKNERIAMDSSFATMQSKAIEWTSQQLKTLENSFSSASALAGKFKDVPAIIASAGPSLEKHFGLLEEIGDRAVIVAPGSTTRIFNARGLNAHIAMSIDSNIIQAGFYKEFNLNSILVASYRLHPETYKNFPNKVFCTALSTEYLSQYYYYWTERTLCLINDHASVSMAAVDMLALMGCNPIILVGQDLSYQDNRNYADDSANSISESQVRNLIPDVDIYGNRVYTDYGYKTMQNDMETQNIRYKDSLKMYNATEGGLNIHGIENVKFVDMYDKYIKDRKHDVADRIAKIIESEEHVSVNAVNDVDDEKTTSHFFTHLFEKCDESEKILKEKESAFVPFAKLIERGVSNNRLNNEIQNIQDYNKRLSEIPFFKQVIMPNIDSSLAYFRASGKHIADSGQDWEGAAMFEQKLDEYALNFINIFKALLLRDMMGDLADTVVQ